MCCMGMHGWKVYITQCVVGECRVGKVYITQECRVGKVYIVYRILNVLYGNAGLGKFILLNVLYGNAGYGKCT